MLGGALHMTRTPALHLQRLSLSLKLELACCSIHYFRVPHEYWEDRLTRLKAMGLNTIQASLGLKLYLDHLRTWKCLRKRNAFGYRFTSPGISTNPPREHMTSQATLMLLDF